jgi:Arginine methyltransferase-interacting protein, contains RING Zn-finger
MLMQVILRLKLAELNLEEEGTAEAGRMARVVQVINQVTKGAMIDETSKEEKKKKWLENAECFNCGKKGHLARNCDQLDSGDEEGDDDDTSLAGVK